MRCRIRGLAWLTLPALAAVCYAGFAQEPGQPPAKNPTPTPPVNPGVVLKFHNGSVVQPAILLESLEMETKLGKIAIPGDELRRIDFGFRLSEEDNKKLEQAMTDLSSAKYQAREAATKTLMQLGRLAYPALMAARKTSELEKAKRIETILTDIRNKVSPDKLVTRMTDLVKTSDSAVAGKVTAVSLRVKSELFGEIKVPVHQLKELRSLATGGEMVVSIDSSKYGNLTTWMETEVEVNRGDRLAILLKGTINMDPANRLGAPQITQTITPDGTTQLSSGEAYRPGLVVARIGTDGPQFPLTSRYTGTADRQGKLYLRIVTLLRTNGIQASGSYEATITAEPQ